LEGQKVKELLSMQMAESKYAALKSKDELAIQMAAGINESKYEALKNTLMLEKCCCEVKEKITVSSMENKFEALKNTQLLSSQMAECCCEVKEKVQCVSNKLDDTVRVLDSQRLRDALNVANNEVNLLKISSRSDRDRYDDRDRDRERYYHHHHRSRSHSRERGRCGGDGGH
jgi:hypothetical protein